MSHPDVTLRQGDCLDLMRNIPDASVDAIVTDPPYPEIDRPYGRMTEAEWWTMMMGVCKEARRILKPTGSAVFILQPNSRKVGSMRGWLFRFQAWACDEWNMVQDAWWWNFTAPPMTKNDPNLLRSSVKACIWLGPPRCYRDGAAVRWSESDANRAQRESRRLGSSLKYGCGGKTTFREHEARTACVANEGVTAFNLIPVGSDGKDGKIKHPARTPFDLCDWWVRYISPEGGTVCDPFTGSGTVGLAALKRGRKFIGGERDPGYFATAKRRLAEHQASMPLLTGVAS